MRNIPHKPRVSRTPCTSSQSHMLSASHTPSVPCTSSMPSASHASSVPCTSSMPSTSSASHKLRFDQYNRYCSRRDAEIQHMIDSGSWIPSLDTGHVYSRGKQGMLREKVTAGGYLVVGRTGRYKVSHIIWIAGNNRLPRVGYEIDHVNGNKRDNRLENLREVTTKENSIKAFSAITANEADEIRRAYAAGESQRVIAKRYRVSHNTIYSVVHETPNNGRPEAGAFAEQTEEEIRRIGCDAVLEIINEYDAGLSYWHIAKNWKVTISTVKAIIARELEEREIAGLNRDECGKDSGDECDMGNGDECGKDSGDECDMGNGDECGKDSGDECGKGNECDNGNGDECQGNDLNTAISIPEGGR